MHNTVAYLNRKKPRYTTAMILEKTALDRGLRSDRPRTIRANHNYLTLTLDVDRP